MPEQQNIEWKESWRDEYLKWICGFANAQGGKIYIGCNDSGEGVGKIENFTVFVDNALPGEKILTKIITVKKNYAVGKHFLCLVKNFGNFSLSYSVCWSGFYASKNHG